MKKQHQTIFGKGKGNCFSTVIASLLDLDTQDVPNFCCLGYNWRDETDKWLAPRGLFFMDFTLPGDLRDDRVKHWGYHEIAGDGPRGCRHSVIGYKGEFFFDPHPDGTGLLDYENAEYGFLIPREPRCNLKKDEE